MPRYNKPGVDWAKIEIRWKSGEKEAALAREYGVSRQAVNQRLKREGWERGDPTVNNRQRVNIKNPWLPLAEETDTARRLASPETGRDKQLVAFGKRTSENLSAILRLVEKGVPEGVACHSVGIDPKTLRAWKEDDETVLDLVRSAYARSIARKVERIDEAGDRGDWKADSWYLERSQATRQEYGNTNERNHSSEDIWISIGIDRDGTGRTETNIKTGESRPYIEAEVSGSSH
jgi:hypothetical protein